MTVYVNVFGCQGTEKGTLVIKPSQTFIIHWMHKLIYTKIKMSTKRLSE